MNAAFFQRQDVKLWVERGLLILVALWGLNLVLRTGRLAYTYSVASAQYQDENIDIDPAQAGKWVHWIASDLTSIRRGLFPLFIGLRGAAVLPVIGEYAGQVEPLAIYGSELARAGDQVFQALGPALQALDSEDPESDAEQVLFQALRDGQRHFTRSAEALERAAAARERIDLNMLPGPLSSLVQKVDETLPLEEAAGLVAAVPYIVGGEGTQRFLLLALNRDELRGGGGFVTGIGTVEIGDEGLSEFSLGDSYEVDDFSKGYPPPPQPLQDYMLADYWVTRDANWSPDFPTAAQVAMALYALSTGVEVRGVVSFDLLAVSAVLEATGPIRREGFPEPIQADNVEEVVHQAWAAAPGQGRSQAWWEQRKDFMPLFGKAIIEEVTQLRDPGAILTLVQQVLKAMEEGHLMLYLKDPAGQAKLAEAGLDNGVHPGEGDFLMVVDSNVGFNKVNAAIRQQVTYSVDLSNPAQPTAQVRLNYLHPIQEPVDCVQETEYGDGTYDSLLLRCYWDYWQVFTQRGTTLMSGHTPPVPGEWLMSGVGETGTVYANPGEGGTQVFSGLMVMPTNSQSEVDLNLNLPLGVAAASEEGGWIYRLRVQKQLGVAALPFTLRVKAPGGYTLQDQEGWQFVGEGTWEWKGELRGAWEVVLVFVRG